jgi:hypothetical protein
MQNPSNEIAYERTDSAGGPARPALEKQSLQAAASLIAANHLPNEEDEHVDATHHATPQPLPFLQSQIHARSRHEPAEGVQYASALPSDNVQPQFGPFVFVNEQELQRSRKNELRKAVRSHVRKGTHLKQRRLNAASKPDPNSVKKLLKRPSLESGRPAADRTSEALPLIQQHEFRPSVAIRDATAGRILSSSHIPISDTREMQAVEAEPSTVAPGPLAFQLSIAAPTSNMISHPMGTFSHVSRYQLDSSE